MSNESTVRVDSVIANVRDLAGVLATLEKLTGLTPFVHSSVMIDGEQLPLALVMVGGTTLEFIGCGRTAPDQATSHIASVAIAAPDAAPGEHELEPGLCVVIQSGIAPAVTGVELHSTAVTADIALLDQAFGLGTDPQLAVNGVTLHFVAMTGANVRVGQLDDPAHLLGWRRFALAGLPLNEAVNRLTAAGATIAVPTFRVMPGLWEAMLCLPSGLIVQPVEQHLWRMLPALVVQRVRGWLGLTA